MTWSYRVPVALAPTGQPWIDPVASMPSHTPASAPVVTQTPGTLMTDWSPWLEQKRLVICGMLLSGPAHAVKLGVAMTTLAVVPSGCGAVIGTNCPVPSRGPGGGAK